jgi:anti-anti-sigma regulatory factor
MILARLIDHLHDSEWYTMSDVIMLERRLEQAEELLNVLDALHPGMLDTELYDLALQTLCRIGNYTDGSLWVHCGSYYQSAAWQGFDRERVALVRKASFDVPIFQQLLGQVTRHGAVHWCYWPLPPTAPEPLQVSASQGHTLFVPLTFTSQIGFAALEADADVPDDEILLTLARFSDKIAVALDTARIFQEHLQTIAQLQRVTEEQRKLQETVLALSAPLLPLLPGVVVLPLIGVIDATRAVRILEAELETIIKQHAEVVIVDITGVSVIDTSVAMQLIRSADAARLLGCRTILVGVQPEIAQTMVGLGVELHGIVTRATLADGLQEALRLVHRRLIAIEGS